jgi:uncharacterized protein (DUF302 family)
MIFGEGTSLTERNFEYTVGTAKSFDEAVEAVVQKTAEKGFRVLHVHDVAATLAEKGLVRDPLKIVEVCNAKYAHRVLQADVSVALFMPCKINVYTEDGQTVISALRPAMMAQFFPGSGIEETANEVEGIVRAIVDESR